MAAALAAGAWFALDWRRPGIRDSSAAAAYRDALALSLDAATTEAQARAALSAHRLRFEAWPAGEYARTWFLERAPAEAATVLVGRSDKYPTGKRLQARFEVVVFVGPDATVLGHRTRVDFLN